MNKFLLSSSLIVSILALTSCQVNDEGKPLATRTIQVQGNGTVQVVPNMASLQIAVETTAPQANEAVKNNASQMTQVVELLKTKLSKDDKLSTSRYTLNPVYEYDRAQQKNLLTGYQVVNYVNFTTKELTELGGILDALAEVGANRIDSLQFTHDELNQFNQQALSGAVKDAHATAKILADSAEVELGEVSQIQPQTNGVAPMRDVMMLKTNEGASTTPLLPGELTVNQAVTVTYTIK